MTSRRGLGVGAVHKKHNIQVLHVYLPVYNKIV